jgi:DNA-binding MarR family transcriptional regulator
MHTSKELFAQGHLVLTLIRGLYLLAEDDVKQNLKKIDISHTGVRILWILYFDEKMTMSELAFISQTDISNVYRQLVKLKEKNLVVINNGQDARNKETMLSENGRKFIYDIMTKNVKVTTLNIINTLKKIPGEDLETFIEVSSILCTELIGQRFTDWAIKAANKIRDN